MEVLASIYRLLGQICFVVGGLALLVFSVNALADFNKGMEAGVLVACAIIIGTTVTFAIPLLATAEILLMLRQCAVRLDDIAVGRTPDAAPTGESMLDEAIEKRRVAETEFAAWRHQAESVRPRKNESENRG